MVTAPEVAAARSRPADPANLVAVALLDRDLGDAVVQGPVDGGSGQADVERDVVCAGGQRLQGRCRSCCRRRRAGWCGPSPTRHRSTSPRCMRCPPALSATTVCGTPRCGQLPGGQRRALVARPGFIDEDVHRQARGVGLVHRGQGGAPFHRGQPAGVAVGEHVDRACRRRGPGTAFRARAGRARRWPRTRRCPRRESDRRTARAAAARAGGASRARRRAPGPAPSAG